MCRKDAGFEAVTTVPGHKVDSEHQIVNTFNYIYDCLPVNHHDLFVAELYINFLKKFDIHQIWGKIGSLIICMRPYSFLSCVLF